MYSVGATLIMSCTDITRYVLVGVSSMHCTDQHVWSSELPLCKRKRQVLVIGVWVGGDGCYR